jgi:hypothetical protein
MKKVILFTLFSIFWSIESRLNLHSSRANSIIFDGLRLIQYHINLFFRIICQRTIAG